MENHTPSLVDLVSEYTSLVEAGVYLKGKCPFEDNEKISFVVSPIQNSFYCFSCKISGSNKEFSEKINMLKLAKMVSKCRKDLEVSDSEERADIISRFKKEYQEIIHGS